MDNLPKLSPFNIARVMKLKTELTSHPDIVQFLSPKVTATDLDELVFFLGQVLPNNVPLPAVKESLLHLVDRPLTMDVLSQEMWRLSGNIARLRKNIPVPEWAAQYSTEWMPMQVVEGQIGRNYRRDVGARFTFRVLAGTATGMLTYKFWTSKFCGMISSVSGFTKSYGNYPYRDLLEYVGFRIYGLFTPDHSEGTPGFDKIKVTPSFLNHNKKLLRARSRDGFRCPRKFPMSQLCHKCPIGYDQCPVAVHPRTFARGACDNCQAEKLFDPANTSECVECSRIKRMARNY